METDLEQERIQLTAKRQEIANRLAEINPSQAISTSDATIVEKKDYHWDYVMKEMSWLANDFQRERARHVSNAKKASKAVDVYHKTKDVKRLKKSKDEVLALKRISSKVSRDVRKFWLKINKVIAFKQKGEADEARQKAMDKHLVFLVKQTERYTNMLAENMQQEREFAGSEDSDGDEEEEEEESGGDSDGGDKSRSTPRGAASFTKSAAMGESAVRRTTTTSVRFEGDAVDDTSGETLEVAACRQRRGSTQRTTRGRSGSESDASMDVEDDGEFQLEAEEADDETTLIEQERLDAGADTAAEMDLLRSEGEMPIEQLRAMYSNLADFSDNEEEEEDAVSEPMAMDDSSSGNAAEQDEQVDDALKRLEVADLAARSVNVERPFVLTKSLRLREYQHVGLNWLVSLHERRLNGILADEMGLGKTVQTIALLAYLAVNKGLWGPHLVVVPTSCIVNWETEFKRFCPSFKVLTYFGSSKARKALRSGWMKLNSFHVCITSYQLVVQDSTSFRRKRWYYMILDEAHNIKNFKSKRWQTLLNFNTQRRLLLTGTPLQNNLMELWSLMHFLMPHIFRSRKEFSYWFSNPLNGMVEGNRGINSDLIARLHSIMRPFLLRRLKKDVAKQLPGKFEHVVMCKLSKRQSHLYEEFMARSSTRASLSGGGNFLGMMNILMQLRKVCNHPDLFEPRPIASPLVCQQVAYYSSPLLLRALDVDPLGGVTASLLHLWRYNEDSFVREAAGRLRADRAAFVSVDDLALDSPPEAVSAPNARIRAFTRDLSQWLLAQKQAKLQANFDISDGRCSVARSCLSLDWRVVRLLDAPHLTARVARSRQDARLALEFPACWRGLLCSAEDRAEQLREVIAHFVFVLPKTVSRGVQLAGPAVIAARAKEPHDSAQQQRIKAGLAEALAPFYPARIRQQMFFPDRKLIQFDSGKLQTLAVLLRDLKRDGHKCLIFTQMSKMLDILEIFLNLHDHTFVRLDGSTGIDRRQKLMDRFNSDPKLFCFILSTRSGGLGINLTGADTVIFYDSDWNPAMDAQAQDRAHRIGQTKEVHIYRLICASTVEENILLKARQKKHLDFLVMTEGNFSETSLFTASGLKDMLGVGPAGSAPGSLVPAEIVEEAPSRVDVEAAMLAAEDEEDVSAMRGARAEAAKELDEFDENAPVEGDEEADGDAAEPGAETKLVKSSSGASLAVGGSGGVLEAAKAAQLSEEKDMETEFASWQAKVGPDFQALQAALKPVERYALGFRTVVEPFYSMFFTSEQTRLEEMLAGEKAEQWDIDEMEREKEEEEFRALAEGELLATNVTGKYLGRLKSWYLGERQRRSNERRKRVLSGTSWVLMVDGGIPFWYNDDTGDASYSTPDIILSQEQYASALQRGYSAVPLLVMVHIFSYLAPHPDRFALAAVCARWWSAAVHESFVKKVLPVETGARETVKSGAALAENTYASVAEALAAALPGDTVVLGPGHHWEDSLLLARGPVRLVGVEEDPARCVVELVGQVRALAGAGSVMLSGLTVRRPRKVPAATSLIFASQCRLWLHNCVLSNEGGRGSVVFATHNASVLAFGSTLRGGVVGVTAVGSTLLASYSTISDNASAALALLDSASFCEDSVLSNEARSAALSVGGADLLALSHCEVRRSRQVLALGNEELAAPPGEEQQQQQPADEQGAAWAAQVYFRNCAVDSHLVGEVQAYSNNWAARVVAAQCERPAEDASEAESRKRRVESSCSLSALEPHPAKRPAMSKTASSSSWE